MNTAIDMGGNNLNNTNAVNATSVNATDVTTTNVNAGTTTTQGETYTGGWFRSQGDNGWFNEKWNGGWFMNDPDWVRSYSDKSIYTGGFILGGSVQSRGRAIFGEYLQVDGIATEGWGCAPNGLIGRNTEGQTLSCQSGVWGASGGGKVLTGFISHGQQIPLPAGKAPGSCTWSASDAANPHPGSRPDHAGGELCLCGCQPHCQLWIL